MSITRTIGVLTGALLIMFAVVLIRSETARLQHEASKLEQQESALRLQVREDEMEIARLKNPGVIHARAISLHSPEEPAKPVKNNTVKPKPAPTNRPRTGGR